MIDQLIGKIFNKVMDTMFYENWSKSTSLSGMSMSQEGIDELIDSISDWERICMTDSSFFDQSQLWSMLAMDALRRCAHRGFILDFEKNWEENISKVFMEGKWYHKYICFMKMLRAKASIVLSSGHVFTQLVEGMMKSGEDVTSGSNANVRSMIDMQIKHDLFNEGMTLKEMFSKGLIDNRQNGDDHISSWHWPLESAKLYQERALEYGSVIKEIDIRSDTFELNSMIWNRADKTATYLNPDKAIMQLLTSANLTKSHYISYKNILGDMVDKFECLSSFRE